MIVTIFKRWAFAALVLLTLTGCQAMTGNTAGENVDDAAITARVKTALTADKVTNLTRVDVDTHNAVVSLNGVVESPTQKARAEDLARRISGVKAVNNHLLVSSR